MNDALASWTLCRGRFLETLNGLSQAQLNWKIHPNSPSIGQYALHVAGAEVNFATKLQGLELDAETEKLRQASNEGIVDPGTTFPFRDEEITPESVAAGMETGRKLIEPIMVDPSAEVLAKEIKSLLGPMIDGNGVRARMAFHAAYHHGQAYLIRKHPDFPKN